MVYLRPDMDDKDIDFAKLPRKERRKILREQKKQIEVSQQKKSMFRKWGIIFATIALVVLGGWWFYTETSKPLPGVEVENQGRDHVSQESWEKFEYNSNPPTSGPHDAVWTKAGIYNDPQGDGHLIHSLEHGYIIISHNCFAVQSASLEGEDSLATESAEAEKVAEVDENCLDFIEKLKERVEKDSWKLILVPRPNLETEFALTAWTRIDKFNTEDANMDRVESFINALRNQGPEKTME